MGRQTTVGLSTTAIFSDFAGYFFGNFRHRYSDTQSVVGFSLIPKCVTLMTPCGYFTLNSVFVPVCLASDRASFENNN